jgi:hypothetical protein
LGKPFTETYIQAITKKGETSEIRGFVKDGVKINGKLKLNEKFELVLV